MSSCTSTTIIDYIVIALHRWYVHILWYNIQQQLPRSHNVTAIYCYRLNTRAIYSTAVVYSHLQLESTHQHLYICYAGRCILNFANSPSVSILYGYLASPYLFTSSSRSCISMITYISYVIYIHIAACNETVASILYIRIRKKARCCLATLWKRYYMNISRKWEGKAVVRLLTPAIFALAATWKSTSSTKARITSARSRTTVVCTAAATCHRSRSASSSYDYSFTLWSDCVCVLLYVRLLMYMFKDVSLCFDGILSLYLSSLYSCWHSLEKFGWKWNFLI